MLLKTSTYLFFVFTFLILGFFSCNNETKRNPEVELNGPLFTPLPVTKTKINFRNIISETPEFNFLYYGYMYNGGGVAAGDINNDGLTDLYFTSNQGSNKLYLNKGSFKFEDITDKAKVSDPGGWTTGVSMIDINSDGLLDIYVCKSGSIGNPGQRKNRLYINNGNLQFTESASQYGLDDSAFSTQAYFLDIERDGDLDMYLVNHRPDFNNNSKINSAIQRDISMESSDQLYRNDGGKFTNITKEAGMLNKTWGLSAAIADFNNDGYPDIYVCNDFLEPDHLYINQKDGSFKNDILKHMKHISFYSMGSDVADFNNDGNLDLVVLDMVSEDHVRSKRNMASMSNSQFRTMVNVGYHHQYMANMLQLNNGNGTYSEIGQLAKVAKTDWSWAPLLADFDNDGWKDLFVTNGIKRDVTDNDYKIELGKRNAEGESMSLDEIFSLMPSSKQKNYAFRNNGNLGFVKSTEEWGLDQALHSNGAAYADLDNDGDLDLVINNVDDFAAVYQNNSNKNYLQLKLTGPVENPSGVGATVSVNAPGLSQVQQVYFNRGFQSSVDQRLHFGLSDIDEVAVIVEWPDGKTSALTAVKANQFLTIPYSKAKEIEIKKGDQEVLLTNINPSQLGIDYKHQENDYDDFINEILLPQKQSTLGPKLAVADVNGDGLEDFFIGGARNSPSSLFIQNAQGFNPSNQSLFSRDADYEDTGALFFDADGDGDQDLYVASGGNEVPENDQSLQHRLYKNDGAGNFSKDASALPLIRRSGMAVKTADIDSDGDLDLFVGGRLIPGNYPFPSDSYILQNEGGRFIDKTAEIAPALNKIGLVTDAIFADYDNDNDEDLIIVGEWMPISIFENNSGHFDLKENPGFGKSNGWWYSIEKGDFDKDGDLDFIVGNLGLNNKFGSSAEKPFHVYCADFDDSGNYDIVLGKEGKMKQLLPVRGKECSSQQMPFINDKYPTYKQFAQAGLEDIYGEKLNTALHYEVYTFASSYMQNNGDGTFTLSNLPQEAQFGPTLGIEITDINKDGNPDVVAVGNIYDAEVETIRYDASRGYVLLGDGSGNFKAILDSGFYNDWNAKDLEQIKIGNDNVFIIANNNGPLSFLKLH
ncbi:MAG: hypothetical protein ACI8VT_002191 [Saprospiraceae bacterium]|jgi:hypothetical protein